MGAFYTNITLRGPEQAQIVDFLKEQGRVAFVSPPIDGCTVVYDEQCESQDDQILFGLASALSARFSCPALAVLIHDFDILKYGLARDGKLVDEYDSCPGYFTGVNRRPKGGKAENLCQAFAAEEYKAEVEGILRAGTADNSSPYWADAQQQHNDLAEALGLPSFSVNLGYHYIEQGEWMEDFVHPVHTVTGNKEQQMSKKPSRGGFGGRPGGPGGGMPNQAGMMRQIQKMQEDMAAAQAALETETVEASVGGGAVTVVITGGQKIQSITVNKEMIDTSDEEWITDLQDLLVAAVNQAIEKAQALASERMGGVTGGLDSMLPGGLGGLFG